MIRKNNENRLTKRIGQRILWVMEYVWLMLQSAWLYLYPSNKYIKVVNGYIRHHISKHQSTLAFLKALAINPKTTGAILPSSQYLANNMASFIDPSKNTLVVELGAGTGVITEAILKTGLPAQQLIAVEYAPHLAKKLRKKFPDVTIIEGNAAHLTHLLKNFTTPIDTIISGLPLRSLPREMRDKVLLEIPRVLTNQGKYIQFTYDIRSHERLYPPNYCLLKSSIVWRNIPPAKVDLFTFSDLKT